MRPPASSQPPQRGDDKHVPPRLVRSFPLTCLACLQTEPLQQVLQARGHSWPVASSGEHCAQGRGCVLRVQSPRGGWGPHWGCPDFILHSFTAPCPSSAQGHPSSLQHRLSPEDRQGLRPNRPPCDLKGRPVHAWLLAHFTCLPPAWGAHRCPAGPTEAPPCPAWTQLCAQPRCRGKMAHVDFSCLRSLEVTTVPAAPGNLAGPRPHLHPLGVEKERRGAGSPGVLGLSHTRSSERMGISPEQEGQDSFHFTAG